MASSPSPWLLHICLLVKHSRASCHYTNVCVKQHGSRLHLTPVSCIFDYLSHLLSFMSQQKMQVFMLKHISLLPFKYNIHPAIPPYLLINIRMSEVNTKFCFSQTISASLHSWLITMPVLAAKVCSDHRLFLFLCVASSQRETAWLAGLTRTEQMMMLLRRRRKTGPVNCARSSTSRQQRLATPASLPDRRVSEWTQV